MTSEVVVMNRLGVALAADSAVTVDMGKSSKVRDSALKVFMLSKYRPVGVMVYHNSSLLGVPLETIIKLFRRDLGRGAFDTLSEYGDALVDFLDQNASLFPEAVQDRYFLAALEAEYRHIGQRLEREFAESGVYGGEEGKPWEGPSETARKVIAERLKEWESHEDADYFQSVDANNVVGRNSGGVHEVLNRVSLSWTPDEEGRRNLYEIAKHLVAKDYFPPDVFSGLVIAGFGEKEHFPAVRHLEIGGVYWNRLKVRPSSAEKVSEENPSDVMAFAYREMVEAFLGGMSANVSELIGDAAALIEEMPVRALEAVTGLAPECREKAVANVRRTSAQIAREFERRVLQGSDVRLKKIVGAVEALTIKELARVASTLVGLSSFEQQMSLDQETVGGPVDVAVISKGDGFVWIDRKHYFPKELNDHFFRNYLDDRVANKDAGVDGADEEDEQEDEQDDE